MRKTLDQVSVIQELVEKFKKNKKLGKKDCTKAKKYLKELLTKNETRDFAIMSMAEVPAETAAKAFVSAFEEKDIDGDFLLESILGHEAFDGVAGDLRRLELLKEMIEISLVGSRMILVDISAREGGYGSKTPKTRFAKKFFEILISNKKLIELPIEKVKLNTKEMSGLGVIVLTGLLQKDNPSGSYFDLVKSFLQWFKSAGVKVSLDRSVKNFFEKEIKKWPRKLQLECEELGLIGLVSYEMGKDIEEKRDPLLSKEQIEKYPGAKKRGLFRLKNADKYIEAIKEVFEALQEDFEEKEKEVSEVKMLNKKLKDEKNDLEDQLKVLEQKKLEIEEFRLEKAKEKDFLEKRIKRLEEKERKIQKKHEEDIVSLRGQFEREMEYNLQEYKNNLKQSLIMDFSEFKELKNKGMDENIGDYLKYLLEKVFKTIEKKGIDLNEDF